MPLNLIAEKLKNGEVIAYPTEAVFGLGCDPNNQSAVSKLLDLKKRPVEKGLILVAHQLDLLKPFIDETKLSEQHWKKLTSQQAQPITWIVPAKSTVPIFLRGQFDTIAVRISQHPAITLLCNLTGFALTSTSANLSGLPPCKTTQEVRCQFGEFFPVLDMPIGETQNPSEIRDIFTDEILRKG